MYKIESLRSLRLTQTVSILFFIDKQRIKEQILFFTMEILQCHVEITVNNAMKSQTIFLFSISCQNSP